MSQKDKIIKIFAISLAVFIIACIFNAFLRVFITITPFNNNESFNKVYSSNIKYVDIDISTSNVFIKYGEVLSVDASNVSKNFKVKENRDTLSIKSNAFLTFGSKISSEVIITIPSNIEELDIEYGAGKLDISDININDFSLDSGAGKVSLKNVVSSDANIDTGAGELVIEDSKFTDLKLNMGAGKTTFNGLLLGDTKIEQGVGELILNLSGDDYTIKANKGLGDIIINGSYVEDMPYGNGSNTIKINGGVGSVNINTNK